MWQCFFLKNVHLRVHWASSDPVKFISNSGEQSLYEILVPVDLDPSILAHFWGPLGWSSIQTLGVGLLLYNESLGVAFYSE